MATYVISDIHGCFGEFQQLLCKIEFSEADRLYLAGDYIDRGKQSLEMLRWLESCPKNVMPIKGNHDAEFAENVGIMRQIDQAEELATDPDSNEDALILLDSVRYLMKTRNKAILEEIRSLNEQTVSTKESLAQALDVTQGVIDIKNNLLNVSNETAQAVNNIANKIDGFNY